ncbi:ABC transporter permease [Clostridium formicaceticum]|uniref:ABC transporter n=1 Tax=Clostridium formicaceticum TaxID=1497 RepID=A0AAC9WHD9_9CLOT|nr:ABC transporter permease [Clostridium formicaceticum]AOY78058.1 ABC transporter [Clostridium formicaceticum]ARE88694.1 ABC-2 type transporter [Clostridium formicaceticum]
MILRSSYFMLRRMSRGYLALIILLFLPLALITVLGMVAGDVVDPQLNIPVMDGIAVTMILAFQLYGGFYTMEFIRYDLMSSTKWRMYALPYQVHQHAFSIILSCTLFSAFQGLVMVLFTQWVYGVHWGNIGLVFLVLLAISILSQLVFLNLVLGVKHYKTAEGLGTVYGITSIALAGVWFPMPESGILNFLSTYASPLALGQNAVYALIIGENVDQVILSIGILLAASGAMAVIAVLLGRRKLA